MSANSSPTDPGAGFTDLLLWPWRVGKALALLPVSFQLHEGQPRAGGTAQHQQLVPTALGPLHDKLRAALGPNEYVLVVPRALHSWQAGQQIFSHALAYNAVEAGVKLLHLQPAAERLMAAGHSLLQGATGYLDSSQPTHRISLMNACAATFSLQGLYAPQEFPWSSLMATPESDLHDPGTKMAHMLALTARLAYEDPDLARQVVEDQWGCTFVASRGCKAAHQHEAQDFATSWFAFATGSALVIAFCGEAAMHQLSWNAARQFHISKRGGLGGVDDTLFSLLLSRPKGPDGDQGSLFDEVLSAVGGMLANRPLYLTGHGMGGALASLFALVLRLKRPHSSHQVAGVYTYGSCPAGDEEFVRKLQAAYPQRLVAHQHPGDVCSLWSPRGYASLSGDACSALPQDVQGARSYLQKLLHLALRPLPGFLHHLPSEYEGALQSELLLNQYTDVLPVSGPAQVILQLGSPAGSPQPEHQQPLSEILTSQPELDLYSTGSDVWGEPHAASLPSALSTPLREREPLQPRQVHAAYQATGWQSPDSLLMAPAQHRHARMPAPAPHAQAPEEENQELAALLAEWDDGDDSYGSAEDSPRTSLMQTQQHQCLQQHQQELREASSIHSGGPELVARGGHSYPAAASARSMQSARSTLEGLPGQDGSKDRDRTAEFVGSTLRLLPSTARSPTPASHLGSCLSTATAPCKPRAGGTGSSCSSASGDRIQASPSKLAGRQRLQRSAGGDGHEKQRLAELAGNLEGLAAAARQLLHP